MNEARLSSQPTPMRVACRHSLRCSARVRESAASCSCGDKRPRVRPDASLALAVAKCASSAAMRALYASTIDLLALATPVRLVVSAGCTLP